MNPTWAKRHILDRLAHGVPIQTILNPPPPKIEVIDPVDGSAREVDDPDWTPPDLPDWTKVVEWLKDEAFKKEWEHARKLGAAYNADELIVLKNKLMNEHDPRMASKYKVMMEMVKTAAMWGDSKYSDRTISEQVNTAPQAPEVVRSKIAQLERELGIGLSQGVVDVEVREVKQATPAQLAHREKLRALAAARKGKPRVPRKPTSET
jgi:hypothetical protein